MCVPVSIGALQALVPNTPPTTSVDGVTVSIGAFQALVPGSTPGLRTSSVLATVPLPLIIVEAFRSSKDCNPHGRIRRQYDSHTKRHLKHSELKFMSTQEFLRINYSSAELKLHIIYSIDLYVWCLTAHIHNDSTKKLYKPVISINFGT